MKQARHMNEGIIQIGSDNAIIRKQTVEFTHYSIHLDSEIGEPGTYRDVISTLFSCENGDDVTIYINSGGGNLDTALAIIEAIKYSPAHIRGVILGACHSAASMISMYCDELVILDAAHSLIHTATFGSIGNTNNVKAQTDFTVKQVEKFLNETYQGFLSAEELAQVKLGVELWFDADELKERMHKRMAYLKKELDKVEKAKVKAAKKEAPRDIVN